MSKKIKNEQHKLAEKRKRDANSRMSLLNLDIMDDIISIGIVLKNLECSEINKACFTEINKICKGFPGVDLSVIPNDATDSPLILCPTLDTKSLTLWEYPLITTNIATTITALSSRSNHIYYYIFDIENIPDIILNNDRVKIITKHDNLKQLINKKDVVSIENFNLEGLISLIVKGLKNEKERSNRTITV